MSQGSLRPILGIDIKPMNFRQVSEEGQQFITVRPIFNMLQQTAGRGSCIVSSTGKEKQGRMRVTIWSDGGFNGPLTLADDQRGWIKISTAARIKEKVMQPTGNEVQQDIFIIDPHVVDVNQMGVFIYRPPQELLIQGIIFYFLWGFGYRGQISSLSKCEVH